MLKSLLIILLCLNLYYLQAQSSEDSSWKKYSEKIALMLSKNCSLNDSARRVLPDFCYKYLFEIKNIKKTTSDELIWAQKRLELNNVFETGLKEKFGNCVYKNYKKIVGTHRYPNRLPNRPNRSSDRITER